MFSKCFVVGDVEIPTTKLPPKPSLKGKPQPVPAKKDSSSDSDSSDEEPPGRFFSSRIII